jgi:putative ABC transport system permease protein
MLHSYLRIALRLLRRNARYVLINVLGLGVAVAFALQAFLNWQFGKSFDNWHADRERIFRVEVVRAENGFLHGTCPSALSTAALPALPDVEAATRIDSRRLVIKRGDRVYSEPAHFVDSNFLAVFEFELVRGRANLANRNEVLITEKIAEKYFGDEDPVGQTLLLYADAPFARAFTVGGVLKNPPSTSSLRFGILTHLDNQYEGDKPVDYTSWKWFVDALFIKLRQPAAAASVATALQATVAPQNAGNPDWKISRFELEPLVGMAEHARALRWNNLANGLPPASIWGQFILGALILLAACFNFANMTISISDRRLKEMGVRKCIGGSQRALTGQLLVEAGVVCTLGVLAGLVFAPPLLDWYNRLHKHTDLRLDLGQNPALLVFLAGTIVATTLLAGAYPALHTASFRPALIFRRASQFRGATVLSRVLLGVQLVVALVAVIMGLAFARNAEFNRTADLGYSRDNVIAVAVSNDRPLLTGLLDACRANPQVEAVAATRGHFGWSYNSKPVEVAGTRGEADVFDVGENYLSTVGLGVQEGLGFDQGQAAPTTAEGEPAVLVNRLFVREFLGGQAAVGELVAIDTLRYRIAGVVDDFAHDNFFNQPTPVVLRRTTPDQCTFVVVRAGAEDLHAVDDWLQATWKTLAPFKPYGGKFQNDVLAESLEVSTAVAKMGALIALVALLLAVSGLYALVSLNALKKRKEIAIRRVLGADLKSVAWLLNRNYAAVLAIGVVAGCLAGRAFALALLDSIFKVHAGVEFGTLAGAAAVLLAVAALTIAIKLRQTVQTNPAGVLRTD